jgi:NAD+ synthase
MIFHKDILKIDCQKEAARICEFIRQQAVALRHEGAVIGLSGGIDSALCATLCVQALGRERVFGLILPEKDSSPVSKEYAAKQATELGIKTEIIDITPTLEALGTYQKRDEMIREIFPEYDLHYRAKITLPPDLLSRDAFNFFTLTVDDSRGNIKIARLKKEKLNGIVAATNTKLRTRMIHLYYYAEKMDRFVCGTTNRSEQMQGFYVKYGDGGVDIEPIAHLYKMQVYQLSEHLGVIKEIRERTPSPDTYSFAVSDEDFYFRIPYEKLDLLLYAWENGIPAREVCTGMDLNEDQVQRAFRDFHSKYRATQHIRELPPSLMMAGPGG